MELWDILDIEGNKTGKTIERGQTMLENEYMLSVHIYLRNKEGLYLIQKRSEKKDKLPGIWDVTLGSVVSGEDSKTTALFYSV